MMEKSIIDESILNMRDALTRLHLQIASINTSSTTIASILERINHFTKLEAQDACHYRNKNESEHLMGIKLILIAMRRYRGHERLQEHACSSLFFLVAVGSKVYQETIVSEDGLINIVATMKRHNENVPLQQHCCWLLSQLAIAVQQDNASSDGGVTVVVDAILNAMKQFQDNETIQEYACHTIRRLGTSDSNRTKIVTSGGIGLLLQAMGRFEDNECIHLRGGAFIISTTRSGPVPKSCLVQVLSAMQEYKTQVSVQHRACHALRTLATNASNRIMIVHEGGIGTVLRVMRLHSQSDEVQEATCLVLRKLATDWTHQVRIVTEGGIGQVLSAMKNHPACAKVQVNGCHALQYLTSSHKRNHKVNKLIAKEGITAIVRVTLTAMRRHITCDVLQEHGCWALASLAHFAAVKIAAQGGIEVILTAMNCWDQKEGIQAAACCAMSNMANDHSRIRAKIASRGGIAIIVSAMQRHEASVNVQHMGCSILHTLALHSGNKTRIASQGGIDRTLRTMRRHADNAKIQRSGCKVLRNLATRSCDNLIAIVAQGGVRVILDAMGQHSANVDVQRRGCHALNVLAMHDETKLKIAAEGGFSVILNAMREHEGDERIQEEASRALFRLSKRKEQNSSIVDILESAGGVETIKESLRAHPKNSFLQWYGKTTLKIAATTSRDVVLAVGGQRRPSSWRLDKLLPGGSSYRQS